MSQPILTEGAYCPACGYDLRASPGDRCPECGLAVVDGGAPRVPWERRCDLGRVVAFARTAWVATARPGQLARAAAGPVDPAAARRFRWVVLAVVTAVASAAFAAVVHRQGGMGTLSLVDVNPSPGTAAWVFPAALAWSAGATVPPVLPVGLAFCLAIGTRLDHWFVLGGLSPARRNRAMVLTRYAAAPLLGGAVSAALLVVVAYLGTGEPSAVVVPFLGLTGWAASLSAAAVVLLAWTGPARYALALPGGGAARAAAVLAGTTVQWAVAAALGLALFPAAVGAVWIMIDGLR